MSRLRTRIRSSPTRVGSDRREVSGIKHVRPLNAAEAVRVHMPSDIRGAPRAPLTRCGTLRTFEPQLTPIPSRPPQTGSSGGNPDWRRRNRREFPARHRRLGVHFATEAARLDNLIVRHSDFMLHNIDIAPDSPILRSVTESSPKEEQP